MAGKGTRRYVHVRSTAPRTVGADQLDAAFHVDGQLSRRGYVPSRPAGYTLRWAPGVGPNAHTGSDTDQHDTRPSE